MTHYMHLNKIPFQAIEYGKKCIELRLYDDRRREIKIGDIIEFTNRADLSKRIKVMVTNLHIFENFAALYRVISLEKCGYAKEEVISASPEDMNKYYSPEEQAKYGVVGIEFEIVFDD